MHITPTSYQTTLCELNPNYSIRLYMYGISYIYLFLGVQTPNCIRQTVFDAVSLDYKHVSVITDATAAATPDVHTANIFDMKNIGVVTPTLEEWCQSTEKFIS
ncbi:hypothetical protein RDI58_028687 [Solanum bulbocastanum]|uniref:Isochorismatase-like domain-containing protein n=1 Tax=Solanum bulbocastanum TaxID=147425 RepID=A0AAN8SSE4_SOLBU